METKSQTGYETSHSTFLCTCGRACTSNHQARTQVHKQLNDKALQR